MAERFGGWHVTGAEKFPNFLGNALGQYADGKIQKVTMPPGEKFDLRATRSQRPMSRRN
jgi:hypothetical protein